jgi:phosphoglycolate phosphatase
MRDRGQTAASFDSPRLSGPVKHRSLHSASPPDRLVSDLRVLLWDIDGTLVRSTRVGVFREYTAPMLEKVFGTAGRLAEMSVSGMTDLQIAAEALRSEGITLELIGERLEDLRRQYMQEMERVTGNGARLFRALPGARKILKTLGEHSRYRSALLTGNIEPAAQLKMRLTGLSTFFQLPGAYGDESHDRRDLPGLAAKRISRTLGVDLSPSQFIVIGDTPNDIECAKHFGARSVAVATGRTYGPDELLSHKPDALLLDLSDSRLVMRTLGGL